MDEAPEIIYGQDERKDVNEARIDPLIRFDAACVLVMVSTADLVPLADIEELKTVEYGSTYRLCDEVKFRDQLCVKDNFGSGFLVAPDMVATAASNLKDRKIEDLRFIAGFQMPLPKDGRFSFTKRNIHAIAEILWLDEARNGALVRLAGAVGTPTLARLRYNGSTPPDSGLHLIGHPDGLPKKYAPGGKVLKNSQSAMYFESNLDAFEGNEGSPVFNSDTHYVEGIFVWEPPDSDFVEDSVRKCKTYKVQGTDEGPYCRVLKANEFAPLVPGFQLSVSAHSGLPMAIRDGSFAEGAPLVQGALTGGNDQWFQLEPVVGDYYRIVVNHSGKVLQVDDDPFAEGSRIVQRTRSSATQQQFRIERVSWAPIHERIVPRLRPEFCLNVAGGSKEPGASIIQWGKDDYSDNQLWTRGAPIINSGIDQVADILRDSHEKWAPVGTWPYAGGNNQLFRIKLDLDGLYVITSLNGTDMVWTEIDENVGLRIAMLGFNQSWRTSQQWRILPAGGGLCWIESPRSGLRVQPNSDGVLECAAPDDRSARQKWRLRLS
jgi:hypothetical protein